MARLVVGADDPTEFIEKLPERSLLILGEPGGTFLSRLFFGPGARLRAKAPVGAVMVRYSPPRVFQKMAEPIFFGPLHHAGDSLLLQDSALAAVVDNGVLVGVVRRANLLRADPDTTVAELMEPPISVQWDRLTSEVAAEIGVEIGPVPVIDPSGRLIGAFDPSDS
jgi:CBS domain-containing protein